MDGEGGRGEEGGTVAQTKEQDEEDKRENYKTLLSFNEIISRERFLDVEKSSSRDVTFQPKGHKLVGKVSRDWQPQLLQIQK